MDEQAIKRIQSDPNYIKLVAERKSFGWTLAIITLVIYYGYIALVAFAPSVIAIPVSGAITVERRWALSHPVSDHLPVAASIVLPSTLGAGARKPA